MIKEIDDIKQALVVICNSVEKLVERAQTVLEKYEARGNTLQSSHSQVEVKKRSYGRYIPIRDKQALIENNISITSSTLRKWHSMFKWPEIFVKMDNRLMIDIEAWNKRVDEAKAKRDQKIEKLKKRGIIQ